MGRKKKAVRSSDPNLKILKVCLKQELPPYEERTEKYLYFLIDDLVLMLGRNYYSDPFVIVERLPEHPLINNLYITLAGEVKVFDDYEWKLVGQIEDDPKQLDALQKIGTTYIFNASKRYYDHVNRTLSVPFHNGTYMLIVDVQDDQLYNDKTVIRYDTETNRFQLDGEHEYEDFRRYHSGSTASVETTVFKNSIQPEVKLSKNPKNVLQIKNGGLFADLMNGVSSEEFGKFKGDYYTYKNKLDKLYKEAQTCIDDAQILVGEETLRSKIDQIVAEQYGQLTEIFDKYDELYDIVQIFMQNDKEYIDRLYENVLRDVVNKSLQWGEF